MGFLDKVKKKAEDAVHGHGGQIKAGVDKAADLANKKTGGKYRDKIESAEQKADQGIDKLDETNRLNQPHKLDETRE